MSNLDIVKGMIGVILAMPREIKIETLQEALDNGDIELFLVLSKVLLEASISEGGIEASVLEEMHNKHLDEVAQV